MARQVLDPARYSWLKFSFTLSQYPIYRKDINTAVLDEGNAVKDFVVLVKRDVEIANT